MKDFEIEIKGLKVMEPVDSQTIDHNMMSKRYLFNCLKDPRQVTRLVAGWWRNRIERNPDDLAYEY